jgi:uncharacterized protein (DUF1697 family)
MGGVTTHVVLVRGVNVGGRNPLPMATFRSLLTELGYGSVSTYLQSGNAVVSSGDDAAEVERDIEEVLAARLGLDARVMVRTTDELAGLVAANPMPEAEQDPTRFYVVFLAADADPGRVGAIDVARYAPDELRPGEGALYVWYRGGFGTSKLAAALERHFPGATTSRNWRTVTALLAMAAGGQ